MKIFRGLLGDLTRQYFVYCEENQRSMAEKEPPFGHIDIFQTWPRRSFCRRRFRAWSVRPGFLVLRPPIDLYF